MYYILIIFLFILVLIALFYFKASKQVNIRSQEEKKREIVNQYKQKLETELIHEKESATAQKKRIRLLQEFNQELSRNIFFTQEEVHQIIKDLSLHPVK